MRKRLLASLMAAALVVSMAPTALASEPDVQSAETGTAASNAVISVMSGTCGATENDNVKWELTQNNKDSADLTYTLTISGDGKVCDFKHTGDYATAQSGWLDYNDQITKIIVSDGVTYLGNYSFGNMSQVTDLALGKDVKSYGNWSLQLLTSLETITVDSENSTFKVGEDGALYSADGKTLYLFPQGRIASNTAYKVPDDVTTIWKAAFKGAKNVVSLDLDQVTTIGDQAFVGVGITEVTVPPGVTSMGTNVFNGSALVTANYDASTLVATQTFNNCTGLKTVTIGKHVTGTGNTPFIGCSNLDKVYFDAEKVGITAGTAPYWFAGCKAQNVTIHVGENCKYVPANFARNFTGLAAVVFDSGSNTVEIGNNAFDGSTELATLTDDYGRISVIGSQVYKDTKLSGSLFLGENLTKIDTGAFMGTKINHIDLVGADSGLALEAVNESNGAFSGISTLTTAKLSNVAKIDWGSFRNCSNLVAVDLTESKGLTSVSERYVFTELAEGSVIYVDDNQKIALFKPDGNYTASKTAIAVTNGGTFADNATFEAGKLATPVKSGYAFAGWYESADFSGKSVTTPEAGKTYYAKWEKASGFCGAVDNEENVSWKLTANKDDTSTYTLTISGEGAMASWEDKQAGRGSDTDNRPWAFALAHITSIVVNEGICNIGENSFVNMTACANVTLPENSLIKIERNAFRHTSFTTAVIPDSVTEIGNNIFAECYQLQSVRLGTGITSLAACILDMGQAGEANEVLTEITLPQKITKLSGAALRKCTSLRKIRVEATDTFTFEANAFDKGCSVDVTHCRGTVAINTSTTEPSIFYIDTDSVSGSGLAKSIVADINGGRFADNATFETGKLTTPIKEGYSFAGWYKNANFNGDPVTIPEAGKVYYAKWYQPSTLTTNIGEQKFVIGEPTEFTFTTTANGDAGTMVVGTSDFSDASAIEKLEYYEVQDGKWYELTDDFGPASGFPMMDATSKFRVTFKKSGNYIFTASMKNAENDEVLCSTEVDFTVNKASQIAPTAPTLKTSGYTTITLNTVEDNANGAKAQYRCNDGTWQDSPEFTGLAAGTAYIFAVRYAETDTHAASEASVTAEFSTQRRSSSSSSSSSSSTTNTVSASKANNGTISLDKSSAKKGDIVTITVTPKDGYKLDKLTVTDAKGNTITVTDKGNGKYSFTMPDGKVTVTPTFVAEQTTPEQPSDTKLFSDVKSADWFASAVDYVVDKGMMNGVGNNKFAPNDSTTRGMLMTVIARYAGQDTTGSNPWYQKGMEWAKSAGVSDGTAPNANITREQLVTMLYRYAKSAGKDVSVGEDTNILSYTDATTVSEYAIPAMQWACGAGIVNGSNGKLLPKNNATRAEVAAILMRFCENVK